jgi:hypothetical protein
VNPCTPQKLRRRCCSEQPVHSHRTAFLCGAMGASMRALRRCQCRDQGQCRIAPASRWTNHGRSAELSGGGWIANVGDVGGAPRPVLRVREPAGRSPRRRQGDRHDQDTTKPTWNQIITPPNDGRGAT